MYRCHSVPLGLMTCKHGGVTKHVSWFMVSSSCLWGFCLPILKFTLGMLASVWGKHD